MNKEGIGGDLQYIGPVWGEEDNNIGLCKDKKCKKDGRCRLIDLTNRPQGRLRIQRRNNCPYVMG